MAVLQSAPPDQRFVALYEAHAAAVLGYARRRTAGPEEAEDVLAETFLIAWRRRDAVPADALPWLFGVAANVLRNRARSERRQAALSARLAAEPALPVEHDAPDPRLRDALAALKPIDREALLLTAWEGLSADRAARAAGCSRATFHVRLHRARKRLAQALEDPS
jgi:RNA polymerase sigma-70 factor (ECF subfamily)